MLSHPLNTRLTEAFTARTSDNEDMATLKNAGSAELKAYQEHRSQIAKPGKFALLKKGEENLLGIIYDMSTLNPNFFELYEAVRAATVKPESKGRSAA